MTAPIQEPTASRTTSGLGYGQRQLFRRPAPASGTSGSVEWGRGQAQIDTSAIDFVEPNFLSGGAATFERTSDTMFDINADGRLVLLQGNPGTYVLAVNIFDAEGDAGADTYFYMLLNFVAPIPGTTFVIPGWFESGGGGDIGSAFEITWPLMFDAGGNFMQLTSIPWTQIVYVNESDEDLVIRMRCAMIKNNNNDAEAAAVICSLVRIGDATSAVMT